MTICKYTMHTFRIRICIICSVSSYRPLAISFQADSAAKARAEEEEAETEVEEMVAISVGKTEVC